MAEQGQKRKSSSKSSTEDTQKRHKSKKRTAPQTDVTENPPVIPSTSREPEEVTDANLKRTDNISWEEFFMFVAQLSAQRSKDPDTQVGACIVNSDKRIVATGYNGMPIGCSDNLLPWGKTSADKLKIKHTYVCHAEMNAIAQDSAKMKGCRLYTTLFPCNECAKIIIQAGIKDVVYLSDSKRDRPEYQASRTMFDMAHVEYMKYETEERRKKINLELKSD